MYIQKAVIENIKSITKFEIEFKNPAGWHVLIGDNGSGKSTIVQAIALGLIGRKEVLGLREDFTHWVKRKQNNEVLSDSKITLDLIRELEIDILHDSDEDNEEIIKKLSNKNHITSSIIISKEYNLSQVKGQLSRPSELFFFPKYAKKGFFSVAFGPYRRFEGGNSDWKSIFTNSSFANLAAHLSMFGEDVAFGETIEWLKLLKYESFENKEESKHTLKNISELINFEGEYGSFLPNSTKLEEVNSDGVYFKDGNDVTIIVNQLSDGYRSALGLLFELIRQLVRVYGSEKVFKHIEKGEMFIDLPGVVLVDEIDAHLHPTWQTRIGQWFLKYFPQLQFIVTTHSPLVCRACEKGSIWKLAAPGSDEESGEVTGIDRERLIYGNILDAYGTGVFGENTSISEDSNEMLNRLSKLNVKSMMGLINKKESEELQELRAKFPTENKIKLPEELKR